MRVYVAGPYSADNVITVLDNIREGMRAATEIMIYGHSPFCPWLDHHFQLMLRPGEKLAVDDYYRYSIDWLMVSDVMVVLPGWRDSKGTVKEVEIAKEQGIPVFYGVEDFTLNVHTLEQKCVIRMVKLNTERYNNDPNFHYLVHMLASYCNDTEIREICELAVRVSGDFRGDLNEQYKTENSDI